QLCLYSDLLREIQAVLPERRSVVPRKPGFPLEPYRVDDYLAYYRLVRRRLEAAVDAGTAPGDGAAPATYPEPVPHCDVCRWWPRCDKQRRADDHLCLVAGISRLQMRELEERDIATLARLAKEPLPIAWNPGARGRTPGVSRTLGARSRRGARGLRGRCGRDHAAVGGRSQHARLPLRRLRTRGAQAPDGSLRIA